MKRRQNDQDQDIDYELHDFSKDFPDYAKKSDTRRKDGSEVFDPEKMVDEVIKHGFDSSVLSEIDDSYFRNRRAKNVLDWITQKEYLGIATVYPVQVMALLKLFADYCPKCSDYNFLNNLFDESLDEIRDRVQVFKDGICPKCHSTRLDFMPDYNPNARKDYFLPKPIELVGVAGQRSGKTFLVAAAATYVEHLFVTLPFPANYFGLGSSTTFYMTFCAVTATQAYDNLWNEFKGMYLDSSWFKEYNRFLIEQSKRLGVNPLVRILDAAIIYVNKRISSSVAAADTRALRGYTRFFAAIDELGWFDAEASSLKIKANANGTYAALSHSLLTVRTSANYLMTRGVVNPPTGYMCNVSSPSCVNDKIMQLLRRSDFDTTKTAFHKATWEMNPRIKENDPDLQAEREENEADFDRDYRATPPITTNPFIPVGTALSNVYKFIDEDVNPAIILPVLYQDIDGDKGGGAQFLYSELPEMLNLDRSVPRCLAVDAGETNNSYALTLLSFLPHTTVAVPDLLMELSPKYHKPEGMPVKLVVKFSYVFDYVIEPLVRSLNIVHVLFDRWNSAQQISELEDIVADAGKKTIVTRHSLDWQDMKGVRDKIIMGNVRSSKPQMSFEEAMRNPENVAMKDPLAHLIYQVFAVRNVGHKVYKPMSGTDDLWRCLALGVRFMFHVDRREGDNSELYLNSGSVEYNRRTPKRDNRIITVSRSNYLSNRDKFHNNKGVNTTVLRTSSSIRRESPFISVINNEYYNNR